MSCPAFDIAVVGSGFAGSLMALIARRLGLSVALLERGQHPRFVIGESSTPWANLLLEELATRYELPQVRPLAKWGSWQRTYPEIACGQKRGFSFFHHSAGQPFASDLEHRNQLLVAASPNNELADTHWYRPDFDQFLMRQAQLGGAEYIDQLMLEAPTFGPNSVHLTGQRLGRSVALDARFLIDGTGPRGFLHRALAMPEIPFEHLPRTQAILSHFEGVQRLENLGVVPPEEQPPYPIDDAAVHHLFEGGWVWVLRFNNGLTSAGIAATETLARELGFEQPQGAWDRLQQKFPTIGDQFRQAKSHFPLQHLPQLSFRAAQVTGANWALLPSAAGFLDPLFSTGFTLTLLGIDRIAKAIQQHWGTDRFAECLTQYARQTTAELLATERLLAACYAAMGNFPVFASLARLYFAPVSFAEIAWRLGHPERAASFLLHDHPSFGPGFRNCCAEALQARGTADASRDAGSVLKSVLQAIAPVDIIGLSDLSRKNWYPAGRDDLLKGADKLGVSAEAMESFLNR